MTSLTLRVPRCLLDPRAALPPADGEGLVAVRLDHRQGRITALRPAQLPAEGGLPLALTPLVDPHVHLDKAFTAAAFPNPAGTMAGALAANLRELEQRRPEQVSARAERALERAWRYGLRALRSHVDCLGPAALEGWEALQQQRRRWSGRLDLQLVALAPLRHWSTAAGRELARRVAADGGLLGTVLGPPLEGITWEVPALEDFLVLAETLGCALDLHIDESDAGPARGLRALVALLDHRRGAAVPITCSHASSLALLDPSRQRRMVERMAAHDLAVGALPYTNFWLLAKRPGQALLQRPQAPLELLQAAGVRVALGCDNVQDPWYPGGDFDPVELLRQAPLLSHQLPWLRQGLALVSRGPARLLALAGDGVLRVGGPADLLVLGASGWGELLARSPRRRVLRAGRWLPPPDQEAPSPLLELLGGPGPGGPSD
jgi:cytosine deaminase